MMGQVNELWGAVEELRRRRGYRGQESEGWLGDERVMNEIGQVRSASTMSRLGPADGVGVVRAAERFAKAHDGAVGGRV